MAGYLESTFQAWTVRYAEDRGWLVRLIEYRNRRNAPDALFIKAGRVILGELKRPKEDLRIGQERERDRLIAAGAEYHKLHTQEQVIRLFYEH